MIKICSPQLGLSPYSSLGGEVYDYQTIRGFASKDIRVLVLLPKGRFYNKSLKNVDVEFFALKHIVPPWIFSFLCLPYIFRTYWEERFDILRIHSPRYLGIAGLIFNLFYPKVPILASAVTVDDSAFYYLIEKLVFRRASKITVQSEYMKKRVISRFNVKPNKVAVTYGGEINPVKYNRIPKEAKDISSRDKVLLFMGSLTDRKNPIWAYEVFRRCSEQKSNIKFVVIGKGPLKNELIKRVENDKSNRDVIFIDSAYGDEKAYWFSRMDILVSPSLDEGFGLVVTEAMSYKKTVVASDIEVFKEIISSGREGFTLPINNMKVWVKTVTKLLASKAENTKIGVKGYKKVRSIFNWERTFDLNKQVIWEMINDKNTFRK